MRTESTSSPFRKTVSFTLSLIFHTSALVVLSFIPSGRSLQKPGDMVTVDIQDHAPAGSLPSSQDSAVEVSNTTPTPATPPAVAAAVPTPTAPTAAPEPVKPSIAVPAPKVTRSKIVTEKSESTTRITPESVSKKVVIKKSTQIATSLPDKAHESSGGTIATHEADSSPEIAKDVDEQAEALMASAKAQTEKDQEEVAGVPETSARTQIMHVSPVKSEVESVPTATIHRDEGVKANTEPVTQTISSRGDGETGSGVLDGAPAGVIGDAELGLPVYSVKPYYPTADKMRHFQGETSLLYTVKSDGTVSNVRVFKSSGSSAMDQSAVKALTYYRYSPQSKDVEVMKSFSYRLKDPAREAGLRIRQ